MAKSTVHNRLDSKNVDLPSDALGEVVKTSNAKTDHQKGKTWGRARDVSTATVVQCFAIMAFCPFLVIYFWHACDAYECDLVAPAMRLADANVWNFSVLADWILSCFPTPTKEGFQIFAGWLAFQALIYTYLPGKIGYGQRTPAGFLLPYVVNGLLAWFVSHVLYFGASLGFGLFPATLVYDHWGGLLIAANVYGYFLTLFSFIKAHLFPSHPADRKFSSSVIYDIFFGIEFNPRFGSLFDFKLFHNGRPGIIGWTLINGSFAAAQYSQIGYVTNSMILLNILHAIYVLDFFYNEDWYLRTIDICHDHFGFYLAWGDSVWLPFMYTLQSHYLVRHPVDLSTPYFILVTAIGLSGYWIFRTVNNQKDLVRSTDGNCLIWGKPAEVIRTEYTTSDGKVHKSLLLISGFWGVSRHFNYFGDLTISLAFCMTCGFTHVLPYFYIVYMFILLMVRIQRDDDRCRGKYGKYWVEYGRIVKYKLIPYIY